MDTTVSLVEAAERMGVHYMTAYRHVRTGRLPATRVGGMWRVESRDVEAVVSTPMANARRDVPISQRQARLRSRLEEGDEPGAWTLVEEALIAGLEPRQIYTELIVPVLQGVEDDLDAGRASVAQEHRANVVVTRLVGRLGCRFHRRGRKWGTVVVGMCEGDTNPLGCAMLADLLREERLFVVDLGPDTPPEAFVETALGVDRLVAVVVGTSMPDLDGAVRATVSAVRSAGCAVPVLAGGFAVHDHEHALGLGADAWTGPDLLAAVLAVTSAVTADRPPDP